MKQLVLLLVIFFSFAALAKKSVTLKRLGKIDVDKLIQKLEQQKYSKNEDKAIMHNVAMDRINSMNEEKSDDLLNVGRMRGLRPFKDNSFDYQSNRP